MRGGVNRCAEVSEDAATREPGGPEEQQEPERQEPGSRITHIQSCRPNASKHQGEKKLINVYKKIHI